MKSLDKHYTEARELLFKVLHAESTSEIKAAFEAYNVCVTEWGIAMGNVDPRVTPRLSLISGLKALASYKGNPIGETIALKVLLAYGREDLIGAPDAHDSMH